MKRNLRNFDKNFNRLPDFEIFVSNGTFRSFSEHPSARISLMGGLPRQLLRPLENAEDKRRQDKVYVRLYIIF